MKRSQKNDHPGLAQGGLPEAPKPSAVRSWLAEVAQAEPDVRLGRLGEVVDKVRRASPSAVLRFRSAEICRLEASRLRGDLNRSLAGMSLPLHPEKEKLPRRFAELHWLLAECYMRVARALAGGESSPRVDPGYLPQACYRGIETLAEHLLINCERYARPRQGTWLNIHKFYNIADAEGVQATPVDPDAEPHRTVAHLYKRVLLLALSDPYRHPFRGVARVWEQLDQWADLASLAVAPISSGRCVFTVDPALDRPAMPALSRSRIRPELNEKWLVTRELVDELKHQYERGARNSAKSAKQPASVVEDLDSLELLRRMVVSWGIHPIRNNSRRTTYKPCDVVIGLKAVCIALNGFEPLQRPESVPGGHSEWLDMIKGGRQRKPAGTDSPRISSEWEIADESERGLKIVASVGEGPGVVSVGELIGYRTGGGDWSLGAVHWAQTGDDNRLSLGLKTIRARAHPVLISSLHTDKPPERARSTGLLLVQDSEDAQILSLLCDKRMYIPTGNYLVRRPAEQFDRVMEAARILRSTRSFVWFEARKPQASTAQRTLDLLHPY